MKQSTLKKRLKSIEKDRKGIARVVIPFETGEVMPVKNCPICHTPSPLTNRGRFVCRACRFLFS